MTPRKVWVGRERAHRGGNMADSCRVTRVAVAVAQANRCARAQAQALSAFMDPGPHLERCCLREALALPQEPLVAYDKAAIAAAAGVEDAAPVLSPKWVAPCMY